MLTLGGIEVDLDAFARVYLLGFGKAAGSMASTLEDILGGYLTGGLVVVKYGYEVPCQRVRTLSAGHPYPDKNSLAASGELLRLVNKIGGEDLALCLISGGGSSLCTDVVEGVTLEDYRQLTEKLVRSGAPIQQINTIRKHLSRIKGGQLSREIFPARLVSLILSDVVGDALDVVCSGPTLPDSTTYADCLTILERYGLRGSVPPAAVSHLEKGLRKEVPENPCSGDPCFSKTSNLLIGSNRVALEGCAEQALARGYDPVIVTERLEGEAHQTCSRILGEAFKHEVQGQRKCLLYGGEATVAVKGSGMGGRNQHQALLAAVGLQNRENITLLFASTDGSDGPCNGCGAAVDNTTCLELERMGKAAEDYLKRFDSYHYFKDTPYHIMTGPTHTNVMDLVVALVH